MVNLVILICINLQGMRNYLLCLIICVVSPINLRADNTEPLSGAWRGEIKMGAVALPLVFNFDSDSNGTPAFTLDSPQQNVKGLPLTVNYLSLDSVSVAANNIGAVYNGKITGGLINGVFSQRGVNFPLTLKPETPIELRRPQTPKPPYPYQSIDTVFTSSDGVKIAGTLTIPDKATKKTPVVVMITGSGPQNRDEEIFEHRPFAVIADYLARNGIASFRYDDRGVGSSEGDYASATIKTFETDCESAVKFVRGMDRFGHVGILGHSEGGTIAMLLAARRVPDFIISLAGMAIQGKETILDQNRHLMATLGLSENDMKGSMAVIAAVFDEIMANEGKSNARIDVDKIASSMNVTLPPMVMQSLKRNVANTTPYFAEMLAVNAGAELQDIKCPFLALNGERDTQVDAVKNLAMIRANNKDAEVRELKGLNHLFQHAATGEMAEYSEIKETISQEVLDIIVKFIEAN